MKFLRRILASPIFWFLFIIFLGLLLRLWKLEARTGFDADQEWLAFKAKELLGGDPVLLGPQTSIGGFSIGPGFIYLWSIFSFIFSGDPIAGAYLSVILGILTSLAIFVAGKFLFDKKTAFFLLLVTAFSFSLIMWDQNPWAPSLFYLAQIALVVGGFLALKKDLGYVLVSLGLALGFQSHFAIFLSLIPIIIFWVIYKPKLPSKRVLFFSLLILFLGFLPTLVFDLFNDFVNTRRLFDALKSTRGEYYLGVSRILKSLSFYVGSTFYFNSRNVFTVLVAHMIFVFIVAKGIWGAFKDLKARKLLILLLLSILVPPAIFLIYGGKFSEYYLMMTLPPSLFLAGYSFWKLKEKHTLLLYSLVLLLILANINQLKAHDLSLGLKPKKQAVNFIVEKAGKTDYGVSLTTALGLDFGYRYIFDYYGASPRIPPRKDEKVIFTIVSPTGYHGIESFETFGSVGVLWQGL